MRWAYVFLAFAVLLVAVIRIRLLPFPLERDEGEYAYGGQLILQGMIPYQLCYTMKFPGTAVAYALMEATFGRSGEGIHLGLLVVSSATMILIFFLGKRLFGALGGVVASASFGLLAASPVVLGFAAHATHFVVLLAVAGTLLLFRALESERLALFFWSGLLLGLAVMMKQPGALFVGFGIFFVVLASWKPSAWGAPSGPRPNWRKLLSQESALIVGAVVPFAVTLLVLLATGMFQRFWFWTFTYARAYAEIPLQSGGQKFLGLGGQKLMGLAAARGALLMWGVALVGPLLLFFDSKSRRQIPFLGSFLLFSCAAVFSGFHGRNHHFVMLIPAVSLFCAGAVTAASNLLAASSLRRKWAFVPPAVFVVCFVTTLVWKREYFFRGDPVQLCRRIYRWSDAFPEALLISKFIKEHSRPADRVAVLGSEPEIYFESDRLSATGFIYAYPLMERQPFASSMQREMIAEVEAVHPKFLVYVDSQASWGRTPGADETIFRWVDSYVRNGYRLVAVMEELREGAAYRWADVRDYSPRGENRILVYETEAGQ